MSDRLEMAARALYEETFLRERRKVTPWLALPGWAKQNWIDEAQRRESEAQTIVQLGQRAGA
jgi:hypothetical protein